MLFFSFWVCCQVDNFHWILDLPLNGFPRCFVWNRHRFICYTKHREVGSWRTNKNSSSPFLLKFPVFILYDSYLLNTCSLPARPPLLHPLFDFHLLLWLFTFTIRYVFIILLKIDPFCTLCLSHWLAELSWPASMHCSQVSQCCKQWCKPAALPCLKVTPLLEMRRGNEKYNADVYVF